MMAVRYYTKWVAGKFTSKPLREFLAAREYGLLDIRILWRRPKAGAGMHRYYRGVLLPALHEVMLEYGNEGERGGPLTEEEVHEMLKARFLHRTYWVEDTGEVKDYVMSLSELSRDDFADYVARVERWLVDFWAVGLDLPEFRIALDKYRFLREYFLEADEHVRV